MSENPYVARRRRLPRFKLSTILVLVAICAWVMACWPWWTAIEERQRRAELFIANDPPVVLDDLKPYDPPEYDLGVHWRLERIASTLKWPILALAAFITWKLVWAIAARRKRK